MTTPAMMATRSAAMPPTRSFLERADIDALTSCAWICAVTPSSAAVPKMTRSRRLQLPVADIARDDGGLCRAAVTLDPADRGGVLQPIDQPPGFPAGDAEPLMESARHEPAPLVAAGLETGAELIHQRLRRFAETNLVGHCRTPFRCAWFYAQQAERRRDNRAASLCLRVVLALHRARRQAGHDPALEDQHQDHQRDRQRDRGGHDAAPGKLELCLARVGGHRHDRRARPGAQIEKIV